MIRARTLCSRFYLFAEISLNLAMLFVAFFFVGPSIGYCDISFSNPPPSGVTLSSCDEFSTQVLHDPWDMSELSDINTGIPDVDYRWFSSLNVSDGLLQGSSSALGSYFYLISPSISGSNPGAGKTGAEYPIDSSKYHRLSIRMYSSVSSSMQIFWNNERDYYGDHWSLGSPISVSAGWNTYTFDLNDLQIPTHSSSYYTWGAEPVTGLRINPVYASGATMKIDWIRLLGDMNCSGAFSVQYSASSVGGNNRYNLYLDDDANPLNGYISQLVNAAAASGSGSVSFNSDTLAPGTYFINGILHNGTVPGSPVVYTSGPLRMNAPPLINILQPDKKGGQSHHPWNMSSPSDIQVTSNLSLAEILPFNEVDGLVGDFFHGKNINGSFDPVNYLMYSDINPFPIDTSVFHNLTYRLLVDGEVDLVLGSVVRVNWSGDDKVFGTTEDVPVFGGWNDYTLDLSTAELVPGTKSWSGVVTSFRVDAHEFTTPREFYFDYVALRSDDTSNSSFAITYEVENPDELPTVGEVSLYYNDSPSTSGGTLITTLPIEGPAGVYVWDTSDIPAGTYYVYLVATDGLNSTSRLASGKIVVRRTWEDSSAPVLSLESPTEGYTFSDWLQLKGYALDNIQIAQLEIFVDNELLSVVHPGLFNLAARAAYGTYAEASNAGFDEIIDTSGLSLGSHTLRVDAVDTAGQRTSSSVNIVRAVGTNPAMVYDPEPNGTPLAVPSWGSKPTSPKISSLKLTKRGVLSINLAQMNTSCVSTLYTDIRQKALRNPVLTFSPAAKRVRLSGKKIALPKQKVFFQVNQDCGANGRQVSGPRSIKAFKSSKARAYQKVLKSMKAALRVVP